MIKKIIKRILGKKSNDILSKFIIEGIISVGKGCDLKGMKFYIVNPEMRNLNITIGDNVCIRGSLIIYKKTSKIIIGNNVYIGPLTTLECVDKIIIKNNVLISSDCALIDTNSHSLQSIERINDTNDWKFGLSEKNWNVVISKPIIINDHCWIGLKSIILKGVDLGEGTIVGAGSVVTKTTKPYELVAGNPAKHVRYNS